jgi:hypothetical protein
MSDNETNTSSPSYRYEVITKSNFPIQNLNYQVDLDTEPEFLVYSNLANDLIALVMARLGQEMSRWQLDKDGDRMKKSLDDMSKAISKQVIL